MTNHLLKRCEHCCTDYSARRERQRFCSKQCQYQFTRKTTVPRVELNCSVCNVTVVRKVNKYKGKHIYCSSCFKTKRIGTKLTSEHKKIISETRKRDWSSGEVYKNALVGRTKWYDHVRPSGETVRCQGTWEVLYANYLDENGIDYLAHRGSLRYTSSVDGKEHVYLPDFYLTDEDCYVDVKNDYLVKLDREKIESIKRCNPLIKLKIITKQELMSMGLLKN